MVDWGSFLLGATLGYFFIQIFLVFFISHFLPGFHKQALEMSNKVFGVKDEECWICPKCNGACIKTFKEV